MFFNTEEDELPHNNYAYSFISLLITQEFETDRFLALAMHRFGQIGSGIRLVALRHGECFALEETPTS